MKRKSAHQIRRASEYWLFTDERLGGEKSTDALWRAVTNLPRGGGVVFRHYSLSVDKRLALLKKLHRLTRKYKLRLVAAAPEELGELPADIGVHRPNKAQIARFVTTGVHNRNELRKARQIQADIVFISPVFTTRSHPGAKELGEIGFKYLARSYRGKGKICALGGMTAKRTRRLARFGADGFGAIDYWSNGPST